MNSQSPTILSIIAGRHEYLVQDTALRLHSMTIKDSIAEFRDLGVTADYRAIVCSSFGILLLSFLQVPVSRRAAIVLDRQNTIRSISLMSSSSPSIIKAPSILPIHQICILPHQSGDHVCQPFDTFKSKIKRYFCFAVICQPVVLHGFSIQSQPRCSQRLTRCSRA